MSSSTFDSTKRGLHELLKQIDQGKMQLPDFQRGWVWDDERIRSLLASIAVSFPIGAVMLLETGGEGVRFKPRPVQGARVPRDREPETLILDGQQRFTSLYQALMLPAPVQTMTAQKRKIERFYYFDMQQMANGYADEEEAILSVPKERVVKSNFGRTIDLDVSTPEQEYENHLFPANQIFDSADWRTAYQEYWQYAPDKMRLFNAFESQVIKRFEQYQLPVIELNKSTPKEAVCLVFEKVNTGGVALTVFELLTATFAADNFQLRDDWQARSKRLRESHKTLSTLKSDDFLQAIALLVTWTRRRRALAQNESSEKIPGISCKRRDILRLSVQDYTRWADEVEEGFGKAARFLYSQHIYHAKDVPYRTQLVPLAATFVALGNDAETVGAQKKIARWYWCGVLGELYGGAVESRFARDLPELVESVRTNVSEPKTVQDATFDANRLLSLRTRNSAAYKGIHALLMRDGCRDFRTGETIELQTFFDDNIDIHHIFPKRWCQHEGIEPGVYNSIINKTAISARTNRIIGGQAPSSYLQKIEQDTHLDRDELAAILETHGIAPQHVYNDDFAGFFSRRAEALIRLIEEAMEKSVSQEGADFLTPTDDYDDEDEFFAEDESEEGALEDEYVEEELDAEDWSRGEDQEELPTSDRATSAPDGLQQAAATPRPAPSPISLANLEQQFHNRMIEICRSSQSEVNYHPTYFLQMIGELGGLEAARRLLQKNGLSDGFTTLYLQNRLDLTVEAQVVKPTFKPLFTDEEIATATRRLKDVGYDGYEFNG